jgi:hypothetical protein
MTVLFIARHLTYFRNFESAVSILAGRGHRVILAADREEQLGGRELVDRLAAAHPGRVSVEFASAGSGDRLRHMATLLRLALDHLRYSDPRYAATPQIRQRALERTPHFAVVLAGTPLRRMAARMLARLERAIPRPADVDDFITRRSPDVVLVTPLIELGSPQLDYVRAARSLGIPSALCVWSWDHLSSKTLIREPPDQVMVWNETQQREAAEFHDIDPGRVIVTGAQCFDQWFDREPSMDAARFRARVGLPPNRPYVLYVCSALFKNSASEVDFVGRWLSALRRSSDARLREMAVLIRPHPQRHENWQAVLRSGGDGVAVWGSTPVEAVSRADYFDSMFHASAVIGLNTSALIEAAIVDRPVFTLLLPEFRDNQEGTFHFRHLLPDGGGFLRVARSLDEHLDQLSALNGQSASRSNRNFVGQFIRPHGLDVPASRTFADAIERLAGSGPPARDVSRTARLAYRPVLEAFVLASRLPVTERLFWHPHRRAEWRSNVLAAGDKRRNRRRKRADKAWRAARRMPFRVYVGAKTIVKRTIGVPGPR